MRVIPFLSKYSSTANAYFLEVDMASRNSARVIVSCPAKCAFAASHAFLYDSREYHICGVSITMSPPLTTLSSTCLKSLRSFIWNVAITSSTVAGSMPAD